MLAAVAPPGGHEYIDAYAARMGVEPPSMEERNAVLALAGVAAHASERIAAPIACWIAGRYGVALEEAMRIAREVASDGAQAPPAPPPDPPAG